VFSAAGLKYHTAHTRFRRSAAPKNINNINNNNNKNQDSSGGSGGDDSVGVGVGESLPALRVLLLGALGAGHDTAAAAILQGGSAGDDVVVVDVGVAVDSALKVAAALKLSAHRTAVVERNAEVESRLVASQERRTARLQAATEVRFNHACPSCQ
jgi:hypothetical protein